MSKVNQLEESAQIDCPICNKSFSQTEVEPHVNKCMFLNCLEDDPQKRKRSPSPVVESSSKAKFGLKQRSPRDVYKTQENVNNQNNIKGKKSLFKKNVLHTSNASSSTNIACSEINGTKDELLTQTSDKQPKRTYDISFKIPLAMQVRPKSLDEFFGQNHVLGKNTMLRTLLERREVPNMILWGPPGCGKTSLSHVINELCKTMPTKMKFVSLCAASCGIKEVQHIVDLAKNDLKFGKKTVLFMDEIHRFNKKQQDVFLQSVERGDVILIGATTENPSFSINNALLSRCKVIVMEKLTTEDLYSILEKAAEFFDIDIIDVDNPAGTFQDKNAGLAIENNALKWLADISDGDAREALSNLQLILSFFHNSQDKIITVKDVEDKLKRAHLLYDRAGEEHYNIISAMHKSIRGSDANAALYWTTRMILSGEDPRYIARRMVRAASEDIGNADPNALPLAIATMQGCQLIGMPEADVLLAQCAIYLARAPKSREADTALARAKQLIKKHKGPQPMVPMHIRNAPTQLMKNLGYGQLKEGEEFTFMPPEYKDVDFFDL